MEPEDLVDDITPEEAQQAKDALSAYFAKHNRMRLDDKPVRPVCRLVGSPEDENGRLMIDFLAFELVYSCDAWPQKVSITWDDFEGADFMDEPMVR